MSTSRQYFDTDFRHTSAIERHIPLGERDGEIGTAIGRVHLDLNAKAYFVSFYVPISDPLVLAFACRYLINYSLKFQQTVLRELQLSPEADEAVWDVVPSHRIFIYHEGDLTSGQIQELSSFADSYWQSLTLRGIPYATIRFRQDQPLAFICHDSRDKDLLARPIAVGLEELGCRVWFDEFSLKVGDSLREKIEAGIKMSRKCILILSGNFFSNEGWTKTEFNAIFTKGIFEKQNVLLPVWYDVTVKQIYEYSPTLADRIAARWATGCDNVVRQLAAALRN